MLPSITANAVEYRPDRWHDTSHDKFKVVKSKWAKSTVKMTDVQSIREWHEGPWIALGAAMINADHDVNILTNEKFGGGNILGYVFDFGWNVTDRIAPDIRIRFGHAQATFDGNKEDEWLASINLSGRYYFYPELGNFSSQSKMLPYIKGGVLFYFLGVSGTNRNESKVGAFGPGVNFEGGLEFLFGKRPQLMIDLSFGPHVVYYVGKKVGTGVNQTTVTSSGFDPQLSTAIVMGIRF